MSLNFINHTLPEELNLEPQIDEQKRIELSKKLGKTNRRLQSRIRAIEWRERKNWQMSSVRHKFI